jgi:hypothetical protein
MFGDMMARCKDDNKQHKWLKQHCAMLNRVADYMGLFVDHEQSIYRQLSKDRENVRWLLRAVGDLKRSLALLQSKIYGMETESGASPRPREKFIDGDEYSDSASESEDDSEISLGICRRRIRDDLWYLKTVANEMARMNAESARLQMNQDIGENGEPLDLDSKRFIDDTFRAFDDFHQRMAQYRMEDWLLERLRDTMLARWRDISYRRNQCAGTLKSARYAEATPSFSRAERNFNSTLDDNFVLPLAPEVEKHEKYFACPVCGLIQETESLQCWEKHVMLDLCPYICVHKNCAVPLKTYPTVDVWMKHHKNAHPKYRWDCVPCRLSLEDGFETDDEYAQHVRDQHQSPSVNEAVIQNYLIPHVRQQVPYTFSECLFCGFKPRTEQNQLGDEMVQDLIIAHMGKHMEAFALDSIPRGVLG